LQLEQVVYFIDTAFYTYCGKDAQHTSVAYSSVEQAQNFKVNEAQPIPYSICA